jgi:hypothetical protein
MDKWTNLSGGEARFQEFNASGWNILLLVLGIEKTVTIEESPLLRLNKAAGISSRARFPGAYLFRA